MPRIIDPPKDQLETLPTPLTVGERKVLELFDAKLPSDWEIYIQPHLNGLRPDFVLLNPKVGIAVFEVKDWNLTALQYYVAPDRDTKQLILMARDRTGKSFSRESENPITKILDYKDEIFELYCPRLKPGEGFGRITAGVIFTCAPRDQVTQLFDPIRARIEGISRHDYYYPLAGQEDLEGGHMEAIFPRWRRTHHPAMTEEAADDLRVWLKEPFASQEQRRPLLLDERQKEVATTRTRSGFRRIKGPAGSGKSLALAARAAELASEGKSVLVVSYNITLINYLRDLVSRHLRDLAHRHGTRAKKTKTPPIYLHFHRWCKRVCRQAGVSHQYDQLARENKSEAKRDPDERDPVFDRLLPQQVLKCYKKPARRNSLPHYDAILVDEGQDYLPLWWKALRCALTPGGEMLLVADKTQNIYGTAENWTEQVMETSGFKGPWFTLDTSYRLPSKLLPFVEEFAARFLASDAAEIDIPLQQMTLIDAPVELRWVQTQPLRAQDTCIKEVNWQIQNLADDTALPDIVFLSGKEVGRVLVDSLEKQGVSCCHTFDECWSESRRQKLAFFMGDARVKATTLHSFKGWEARHLVVYVDRIAYPKNCALLYTALTRLRGHPSGSTLTVVSSCEELADFGSTWPNTNVRPGEQDLSWAIRQQEQEDDKLAAVIPKEQDWLWAEWLRADKAIASVKVVDCNRGGVLAAMGELQGFVPARHLSREIQRLKDKKASQGKRFVPLVDMTLQVKVIGIERRRNRLILSEKEASPQAQKAILEALEVGETWEGVVSGLAKFGAFVNIGGAVGLIHISELSGSMVNHPSEALAVGEQVTVKIISVDKERKRIGLSLRQL